tara:strand:+ start:83 stop:640 length:558 start_codon:yes stop_codon:yes gene_type:complete
MRYSKKQKLKRTRKRQMGGSDRYNFSKLNIPEHSFYSSPDWWKKFYSLDDSKKQKECASCNSGECSPPCGIFCEGDDNGCEQIDTDKCKALCPYELNKGYLDRIGKKAKKRLETLKNKNREKSQNIRKEERTRRRTRGIRKLKRQALKKRDLDFKKYEQMVGNRFGYKKSIMNTIKEYFRNKQRT